MAVVLVLLLLVSQLNCSLSGNTTTTPAPGPASQPNGATEAPLHAKKPSQKELLGTIGVFNLTALSKGDKPSNQKDTAGNTASATGTPPDKSHSQKSLLGSFGSFALPKPSPEQQTPPATESPKPVPQVCIITDMCKTMNGICNKGTCVHIEKNCEADIKCDCDPGYTGQFCSIAIADIPDSTTKPSTTSTKATVTSTAKIISKNDKHHVNGKVDKTKIVSNNKYTKSDNGNSMDNGNNGKVVSVTDSSIVPDRNGNGNGNGNGKNDKNIYIEKSNGQNGHDNGNGQNRNVTSKFAKSKNKEYANSNGLNVEGNPNRESVSKGNLKDGSYRKGPEASFVADNSPISLDGNKMDFHKIKTGNISVISQITDTVTLATVSVKTTFIETINRQTARLHNGIVDKVLKQQRHTQKKKNRASSNSQPNEQVTKISTTQTPTTTTELSQTKKIIVDSSNNMTINIVSKASIKNLKQTVVTETNGSVDIQHMTVGIKSAEASIGDNKKPKSGELKENRTLLLSTSKPSTNKVNDNSTKTDRSDSQTTTPKNAVKHKQQMVDKKKQNGTAGKHKTIAGKNSKTVVKTTNKGEKPSNQKSITGNIKTRGTNGSPLDKSVFSPIIDLLQRLESPPLVQKSLDIAHKGKHSESLKNMHLTVKNGIEDSPTTTTPNVDNLPGRPSSAKI